VVDDLSGITDIP